MRQAKFGAGIVRNSFKVAASCIWGAITCMTVFFTASTVLLKKGGGGNRQEDKEEGKEEPNLVQFIHIFNQISLNIFIFSSKITCIVLKLNYENKEKRKRLSSHAAEARIGRNILVGRLFL